MQIVRLEDSNASDSRTAAIIFRVTARWQPRRHNLGSSYYQVIDNFKNVLLISVGQDFAASLRYRIMIFSNFKHKHHSHVQIFTAAIADCESHDF